MMIRFFFVIHILIVGSSCLSKRHTPAGFVHGFIDFQVERNRLENKLNFFPLQDFVPEHTSDFPDVLARSAHILTIRLN